MGCLSNVSINWHDSMKWNDVFPAGTSTNYLHIWLEQIICGLCVWASELKKKTLQQSGFLRVMWSIINQSEFRSHFCQFNLWVRGSRILVEKEKANLFLWRAVLVHSCCASALLHSRVLYNRYRRTPPSVHRRCLTLVCIVASPSDQNLSTHAHVTDRETLLWDSIWWYLHPNPNPNPCKPYLG